MVRQRAEEERRGTAQHPQRCQLTQQAIGHAAPQQRADTTLSTSLRVFWAQGWGWARAPSTRARSCRPSRRRRTRRRRRSARQTRAACAPCGTPARYAPALAASLGSFTQLSQIAGAHPELHEEQRCKKCRSKTGVQTGARLAAAAARVAEDADAAVVAARHKLAPRRRVVHVHHRRREVLRRGWTAARMIIKT